MIINVLPQLGGVTGVTAGVTAPELRKRENGNKCCRVLPKTDNGNGNTHPPRGVAGIEAERRRTWN